jgi:hypothetical protein
MYERYAFSYGNIILLISIICGIIAVAINLRRRRYVDAVFIVILYVAPPAVFFSLTPLLTAKAAQFKLFQGFDSDQIRGTIILLLSPFVAGWAMWLIFGGYAAINDDIDFREYLASHFTRDSLFSKLGGLILMTLGTLILVATLVYIPASLLRLPTFVISLLIYFFGALMLVFPGFFR